MVLNIAGSLINLINANLHSTTIDNYLFRLHYRLTTTFCYAACALVTASEYIGKAIQCYDGFGKPVPKPVNTYCWIMSTFTINSVTSEESHYSHRDSNYDSTGTSNKYTKIYHTYYQWVPFVLFFQGCLFYLPYLIWKINENKTVDSLLQGLQFNSFDNNREKKINNIVKYLQLSRGHNGKYCITYIICETLNFVNVIGQMFLIDIFLGGVFMTYGIKVLNYEKEGLHDPLITTFPRVTKCNFYKYGPSGTVQLYDAACILPQNILNEKIFIAMWWWFIILATITAMQIVWHLIIVFSPSLRFRLLESRGKLTIPPEMELKIQRLPLGDYFLLDILNRNLDSYNFKELILKTLECEDRDKTYRSFYYQHEEENNFQIEETPI